MPDNLPLVSIVIPCRNEERFISRCLDSIIDQDYPKNKFEILVVDGMSEDGTRQIVEDYSKKYPFIRLLGNPKKITPCALNTGIKNAKGEIIIRMDAHAKYQNDYISKCVKYLYEYNADDVGGMMVTLPQQNTFIGTAIVNVLTSRFGVGNSDFRTGTKQPKETDTVFGGCYKKEMFEKIGFFNENLSRSQDIEFNTRLKKSGGKIMLFPDIISYYYACSDFKSFCTTNFRSGIWAIYPIKFVKYIPVRLRHLIPLIFVSGLFGSLILSFFFPIFIYLFWAIVLVYLLTNLYFSGKICFFEKDWRYFFITMLIFFTFHMSYSLGSLFGLIGVLFSGKFWQKSLGLAKKGLL